MHCLRTMSYFAYFCQTFSEDDLILRYPFQQIEFHKTAASATVGKIMTETGGKRLGRLQRLYLTSFLNDHMAEMID